MTLKRHFSCLTRTESKYFLNIELDLNQLKSYQNLIVSSGKISRDELVKVLTDHGTMKVTLEEAEDYIAMVDTDDDGMMNYSEFVTLFTQKIGI